MRNKQQTFSFWSLLIDEYLEVTFDYWKDLNEFDLPQLYYRVTDINSGAEVPKKVKDEIDEYIFTEIYNLIEE
jgi:hypothetical protein